MEQVVRRVSTLFRRMLWQFAIEMKAVTFDLGIKVKDIARGVV
jgi:hypothetical protein